MIFNPIVASSILAQYSAHSRGIRMKFNSLEKMMQQSLRDPIVLSDAIEFNFCVDIFFIEW
jgi:hypothetical protein